nr:hypothetical protein [Tanacetum cinerariifolium]
MENGNPPRTLGYYSRPSHKGYRNTIELPDGNNVVPLRSDTIRLVQNGCSFHELRSEDLNQHLKEFLKIMDSLDLNVENRERIRLRLFQFSLRDQASNWLERLLTGSVFNWEDLTTRESLSEAWTRFKDLLQKFPRHGIDLWLQIQIFFDHVSFHLKREIDHAAGGKLRDKNAEESSIENDKGTESDAVVNNNVVDPIDLVDKDETMDEETDNESNGSVNDDLTR